MWVLCDHSLTDFQRWEETFVLIMKFFAHCKFLIFSFHGFIHVIEAVMGGGDGKRGVLTPSENKLGRAVTI